MQISANVRILIEAARVTPPLFLVVASQVPARIKAKNGQIQIHNKNTKLLCQMVVWEAKVALDLDDSCRQIQIQMKTQIEQIQMFEALHRRHTNTNDKYKIFWMQRQDSALDKTQIQIQLQILKQIQMFEALHRRCRGQTWLRTWAAASS